MSDSFPQTPPDSPQSPKSPKINLPVDQPVRYVTSLSFSIFTTEYRNLRGSNRPKDAHGIQRKQWLRLVRNYVRAGHIQVVLQYMYADRTHKLRTTSLKRSMLQVWRQKYLEKHPELQQSQNEKETIETPKKVPLTPEKAEEIAEQNQTEQNGEENVQERAATLGDNENENADNEDNGENFQISLDSGNTEEEDEKEKRKLQTRLGNETSENDQNVNNSDNEAEVKERGLHPEEGDDQENNEECPKSPSSPRKVTTYSEKSIDTTDIPKPPFWKRVNWCVFFILVITASVVAVATFFSLKRYFRGELFALTLPPYNKDNDVTDEINYNDVLPPEEDPDINVIMKTLSRNVKNIRDRQVEMGEQIDNMHNQLEQKLEQLNKKEQDVQPEAEPAGEPEQHVEAEAEAEAEGNGELPKEPAQELEQQNETVSQ